MHFINKISVEAIINFSCKDTNFYHFLLEKSSILKSDPKLTLLKSWIKSYIPRRRPTYSPISFSRKRVSQIIVFHLPNYTFSFFELISEHAGLATDEYVGRVTGEHAGQVTGKHVG